MSTLPRDLWVFFILCFTQIRNHHPNNLALRAPLVRGRRLRIYPEQRVQAFVRQLADFVKIEVLGEQGQFTFQNPEERIGLIARSYAESPHNTLVVSPDNASRQQLNLAVRQELKANGAVAPKDHALRVPVQRQDMTGAERAWASMKLEIKFDSAAAAKRSESKRVPTAPWLQ